jgi:UPF0755 protein
MKKIKPVRVLVVGIVTLALLSAGAIFINRSGGAPDFACGSPARETVTIDIHSGESGSSIGRDLAAQGVVKSSEAFFRLAVSDRRANSIAPGVHSVEKNLCAKEALNQLLDPKRISNLLVVTEGAWSSEIKGSLTKIGFTQAEVDRGFSRAQRPAGFTSLEGLLFPAQYSFDTSTSVAQIVSTMVKRGLSEMQKAGISQKSGKFTPMQLLIIASLIQAEGDTKDYSKISQVVRNRLSIGMPLQFDSTIHYIKGSRGSVFLSTQSTFLKSPYNTYRNYGLPPTPINNPGAQAMYAAAHPEQGNWLYFITVAPGDTRFTDSLDQFYQWKALYKKNLKAGAFRSKS